LFTDDASGFAPADSRRERRHLAGEFDVPADVL